LTGEDRITLGNCFPSNVKEHGRVFLHLRAAQLKKRWELDIVGLLVEGIETVSVRNDQTHFILDQGKEVSLLFAILPVILLRVFREVAGRYDSYGAMRRVVSLRG